jgi:predicted nucleic acid-binding protein
MEQPYYLIDTNAVIDFLGEKLPVKGMAFMNGIIDAIPNISVITKIELLAFNAPEAYYKILSEFIDDSIVLELTSTITDKTIQIRRMYKTKLPDAIIAATALVNNLVLITRNRNDFIHMSGLELINPYEVK